MILPPVSWLVQCSRYDRAAGNARQENTNSSAAAFTMDSAGDAAAADGAESGDAAY